MKWSGLIFAFLLVSACKSKRDLKQEVLAIREMNDLATVEYVVTKIIKTNDNTTWYKIGDRKILMSCRATIRAGIDFSKIDAEHVNISGEKITIELPRAKMISLNIRPEDIRVEYQEVGIFRKEFSQSEKDFLLSQGETQIKAAVGSLGVLETAETNAAAFITGFLKKLGYKTISITFVNDYKTPVG